MSKIAFIFCEDELQQKILNKLVGALTSDISIRLIKTAGKTGQNAFAKGFLERGGAVKADYVFIFRDRDFDFPVSSLPQLLVENDKVTSHRTTIENYLLDPNLFQHYCDRIKPNDPIDATKVFQQAAQEIAPYSAVRHTLGFFRKNYSFGTTWKAGSGDLPGDLTFPYCQEMGWGMIAGKQDLIGQISDEGFKAKSFEFFQKFNHEFIETGDYLIWFNGKDLQKAISRLLPFQFTWGNFESEALKNFDFRNHPDLEDFYQKLNNL